MSRQVSNVGLCELLASHRMQVADLASVLNVHRTQINHFLAGRKCPRLEAKMAAAFGLSVRTLRRKLFPKGGAA